MLAWAEPAHISPLIGALMNVVDTRDFTHSHFRALNQAMDIANRTPISVLDIVTDLRSCRNFMVQTLVCAPPLMLLF